MDERTTKLLAQATTPGIPQIGVEGWVDQEKFAQLIRADQQEIFDEKMKSILHEMAGLQARLFATFK